MSRRETDSRGERAMGIFLDKYFYSFAQTIPELTGAKRVYDRARQVKGIDVISDRCRIDEKTQLYYINKPLNTFAFEVDYFSEKVDSVVDGWFVSQSSETDYYLLLWIVDSRTTLIHRLVADDFEKVEAILISKESLKSYLEKNGITDDEIKKKAIEMRRNNIQRVDFSAEIHMVYSMVGYSEQPVNLVIGKSLLGDLGKRFIITKQDVRVPD